LNKFSSKLGNEYSIIVDECSPVELVNWKASAANSSMFGKI